MPKQKAIAKIRVYEVVPKKPIKECRDCHFERKEYGSKYCLPCYYFLKGIAITAFTNSLNSKLHKITGDSPFNTHEVDGIVEIIRNLLNEINENTK